MKKSKKLLVLSLILMMLLSVAVISASAAPEAGTLVSNAIELIDGEWYTKGWTEDNSSRNCYNKIEVLDKGYITFTLEKPTDDDGDVASYTLSLYDTSGKIIWDSSTDAMEDTFSDVYEYKIGLAAGTYYINIDPDFYVTSGTIDTSYKYVFTAADNWEVESNDDVSKATHISLDEACYGIFGDQYLDTPCKDYYSFDLKAGHKYTLTIYNYNGIEAASGYVLHYIFNPDNEEMEFDTYKDVGNSREFNFSTSKTGKHYYLLDASYDEIPVEYQIKVSLGEHSYTSKVTKAATCTSAGVRTYTCSCGKTYTETIKAIGHKLTTLKAVAATCTKSGKTEGKKCTVCNTVTVAQKTVAKKKHVSDKGTVTKKATYKATGVKTYKCKSCKAVLKTETIKMLALSKAKSLKATPSTTSVKFTWKAVKGAEKYEVAYSTNGKKWTTVTSKKTSVTVKKLKAGTTYKVKVRAVAGKNKGAYTSVLSTMTKPAAVTLKSVKSAKTKTADVAWAKVAGVTGYQVEYSTSKKFTSKTTKTATVKKDKTVKTTLKKLSKGKTYYVRVRAYKVFNDKNVYGAYSAVKSVKVK